MTKSKTGAVIFSSITLIAILGLVWGIVDPINYNQYQEVARTWIFRFGVLGSIVFVVMQAVQVIVFPISHYAVGALGGFIYGPIWGGVLNYLGRVIGHIIAFMISRRFGRVWMVNRIPPTLIEKYDRIIGGESQSQVKPSLLQPLILCLIYFLPLFPDDEISYIVGLSKMDKKLFVLANVFGQLGGAFSLAYIGSGIDTQDTLFWVLTIVTVLGFPALLWVVYRGMRKQ